MDTEDRELFVQKLNEINVKPSRVNAVEMRKMHVAQTKNWLSVIVVLLMR